MRLILASASPRRAELLRAAGYEFDIAVADVDEATRAGEAPRDYVRRLAIEKCEAVAATVSASRSGWIVLAADTTVVAGDGVLGKPRDRHDAERMLRVLSGREHLVLTGVAVRVVSQQLEGSVPARVGTPVTWVLAEVDETRVWFTALSDGEIAWYLNTGEWTDKAGGYGIQGLASRFIPRIDGSYSNVVGLPVARVHGLLKSLKIPNFR